MKNIVNALDEKITECFDNFTNDEIDSLGVGHYLKLLGNLALYSEEAQYLLFNIYSNALNSYAGCEGNCSYDFWSFGYNKRSLFFALLTAKMYAELKTIGDFIKWEYSYDINEALEEKLEDIKNNDASTFLGRK